MAASESCLEQLQGNWVYEASGAGEPLYKKIIQIKAAKLELRTIDGRGQTTLLARGDVTLQDVRASQDIPQRPTMPQNANRPRCKPKREQGVHEGRESDDRIWPGGTGAESQLLTFPLIRIDWRPCERLGDNAP